MKKLLVVLLALVMVIAMATSAMAFTDTDDLSTVQQDSVYRLYALGILNGYPDGTFGADNQITRAEFAKIACIVAGFGDVSDLMSNTPSSFTDVAVGMWYTGYVNVAASQGYVHGYPDGTFKPNAPITMAEVVTVLMRIAGYNDNLPGPWPFDYIAQAGKEDVTDDVTFVSSVAATRADVAVMVNHLLDVDMVNYDNDISDFIDDEDEGTVLESAFGATILNDVVFYNDCEDPDAIDAWGYANFDEREINLYFSVSLGYVYDDYWDEWYPEFDYYELLMNDDCYISGGYTMFDLGGMTADVIVNDDDEVIYVHITSSFEYSDDVSGEVEDDDVEVNGDSVNSVDDPEVFADWYHSCFDEAYDGYAKVFYNEDGDVYAISDLTDCEEFGDDNTNVVVVDSYDADDEVLDLLASTSGNSSLDLEDEDYAVYKDGEEIDIEDLEQMDLVYIYEPYGDADLVLVVGSWSEGNLDEAADNTLTIDGGDYDFYFDENSCYTSYINTEGGVDGDYDVLDYDTDLDDVFDNTVQYALYPNPYALAFVVSDVEASSATVYGIVTDLTISGLFDNVTDVTILNQDGEEVTYDVDDALTYDAGEDSDVELGSYVEVELDADGVIDTLVEVIYADDMGDDDACAISSSKINIDGTWYKVTDDTLVFETVTDGEGYDSDNFDEANLIAVDDLLDAEELLADNIIIVSNDGGTLERLFVVDSSLDSGDEGYSFVDRMYTNSSGDFVEMMDGTIAERDGDLDYDTFYSYNVVGGEIEVEEIFYTGESYTAEAHNGSPVDDGFWVLWDGTLASDSVNDYALGEFIVDMEDLSGDTLTLEGDYYTLTDDTQIFTIDASGVVDTGDEDDIEDAAHVGAISDEDGNLLFVFVLAYAPSMP